MAMTTPSFPLTNLTASNSTNEINQDDNFTFEAQTIIVVSILIFGLLGNGFVCFAFYHYPSVRSLTNYVMVNLAFADLLLVTFLMVWIILDVVKAETSSYVYNMLVSIDVLCTSTSMLNLAMVGIDRYIAVVYALRYQAFLTKRLVKKCSVYIWSFSFAVATIAFSRQFVVNRPSRVLFNQAFMMVWAVFIFVIPTCVIVFAYAKVFMAAWKQIEWTKKHMQVQNHRTSHKMIKKEIRLSLKLSSIVFPFCTMWGCYFGITLYEAFCSCGISITGKGLFIIGILPHIVAAINPIIYIFLTKDLRGALRKAMLAPKKRLSRRRVGMTKATTLQNLVGYLSDHASARPSRSEESNIKKEQVTHHASSINQDTRL